MSLIKARPRLRPVQRLRRVAGYALLEALVAVVIASVGFIGAARLQTLGMKMNSSAQYRQKAVLLTYQMADRVRANRAGFGAGAYNNPAIGSKTCLTDVVGCTPAQLAVADMTEWSEDITGQLPGGSGVVCVDSTPNDGTAGAPACDGVGSMLAVKVWWADTVGASRFVAAVRP
jgi:type IV pilus assembly protein PilV